MVRNDVFCCEGELEAMSMFRFHKDAGHRILHSNIVICFELMQFLVSYLCCTGRFCVPQSIGSIRTAQLEHKF